MNFIYDGPDFDGATYDATEDYARLGCQFVVVRAIMLDGQWHTLAEIEATTGYPQAAISARIRDLRKEKFGGYTVQSRRAQRGLWYYRVVICDRCLGGHTNETS